MNKLPRVTVGFIIELLPFEDLLTCRLVCKLLNEEVEHYFSLATQVRFNESHNSIGYSFIPDAFFSSLICLTISLKNFDGIFTFLSLRCPNLRVFTSSGTIELNDLVKIGQNLQFFHVSSVAGCQGLRPSQIRPHFPALKSFVIGHYNWNESEPFPVAFCPQNWAIEYRGPLDQPPAIQWSDICCKLHRFPSDDLSIPPGIYLYNRARLLNFETVDRLNDESVAKSLRVLRIRIPRISFKFTLPALQIAEINFQGPASSVIKSFTASPNLQVINFTFQKEMNTKALISLISSLKKLKTLYLLGTFQLNKPNLIELSLPEKLVVFKVRHFDRIKFAQNQWPKSLEHLYLENVSYVSSFNCPRLTDFNISTDATLSNIDRLFNSLKNSKNLRNLDVYIETKGTILPESCNSVLSGLSRLEHLKFVSSTPIRRFTLRSSNYPQLALLSWNDSSHLSKKKKSEIGLKVIFDQECESVCYYYTWNLKIRPRGGQELLLWLDSANKLQFSFKYPLHLTVTRATLTIPDISPSFKMPKLIECTIIFDWHGRNSDQHCDDANLSKDAVMKKLTNSLALSPKLQVVTLITNNFQSITPANLDTLFFGLSKLPFLNKLQGRLVVSEHFEFSSALLKYPSLSRVQCECQFIEANAKPPNVPTPNFHIIESQLLDWLLEIYPQIN